MLDARAASLVAASLLELDEIDLNPEYFRALSELCNQLHGRTADEIGATETELRELAHDPADARSEFLSEIGAAVVDSLAALYVANDHDAEAVGEQLYEIDKAARRRAQEPS